jgi:F-type H+-transporting ATPase subunit a
LTEKAAPEVDVKSAKFRRKDRLYLAMMILPILACIVLKVLFTPAGDGGVQISGAMIFLGENTSMTSLYISESQVNTWAVMISILGLCLYMTHGLSEKAVLKRQLAAEWIVEKCETLVKNNMGGFFREWAPFVAAIMGLSAFSSLICLVGLFSPTGDVNVTFGWAILVFFMIMYYKFRGGLWNYTKGLFSPIPVFAPMNLIGEFATPVSMAFRHYGNILSGAVISALIGSALTGLSKSLLGWLPGVLSDMPLLRVGLPAVLSVYFDVFSGVMQAFIFAMLTMLNVAGAVPWDDWNARRKKRNKPEIQNLVA